MDEKTATTRVLRYDNDRSRENISQDTHSKQSICMWESNDPLSIPLTLKRYWARERERERDHLQVDLTLDHKTKKPKQNRTKHGQQKWKKVYDYTTVYDFFVIIYLLMHLCWWLMMVVHTHTSHGGSPAEILTMKGNFIKVHTHDQRRRVGDKIPMVYNSVMIEK